jgi:hypothetical protein
MLYSLPFEATITIALSVRLYEWHNSITAERILLTLILRFQLKCRSISILVKIRTMVVDALHEEVQALNIYQSEKRSEQKL